MSLRSHLNIHFIFEYLLFQKNFIYPNCLIYANALVGEYINWKSCAIGYCGIIRDLILGLGDDALLYVAYAMLIMAPLIPATRWSCS